jgi:hypothetical protein
MMTLLRGRTDALAQSWLLLFTAFLPALAIMILLNNVAEEIGWTGYVFARFQDRHGPLSSAGRRGLNGEQVDLLGALASTRVAAVTETPPSLI